MNPQVSKKFTDSMASLYNLKNQFDNRDAASRESKAADIKNYGSIKRTQNNGTNVTLNPYGLTNGQRSIRYSEECGLREKF